MNIQDIKAIAERYPKKVVHIKYSDIYNKNNPMLSKILGLPYWETDASTYPLDPEGRPMAFLAQINFEYVLGLSPLFPEKGILQFYVGVNSTWGMDFKELFLSGQYFLKYWSEPCLSKHVATNINLSEWEAPVESTLRMHFKEPSLEYCGGSDTYYADIMYGDRTEWTEEMDNFLLDNYDNKGSKIGGYAAFNNSDPRTYDAFKYNHELGLSDDAFPEWILLFQMDCDHQAINWGEHGSANWFINKADLLNLRFDRVLYNWDC